jgi:F0F1-type ATP synthase assembly protein I
MFGPTIGGTVVGIGLDNYLHTAPWCTVVMVGLGFIVSMGLVIQQITGVKKK